MYIELMLLAMLIFPIWGISGMIMKKETPFAAIGMGTIFAGVGSMIVIGLVSTGGQSLGALMEEYIKKSVDLILSSPQYMDMLKEAGIKAENAETYLSTLYTNIASILPAIILTISAIISYFEYNLLIKIRYRKVKGFKPLAYVRNFSLQNKDVIGWFAIYCIAYLLQFVGVGGATETVLNINVLVEMIFSLQGISFIMLFCFTKRIPKAIPVIGIIIIWMFPVGKTVLFTLGLLDMLMNFRGRIQQTKL